MADCKAYREEIEESAGAERLSLEARSHAGACASCGEFEREHNALRRLVGGLGKVEAPADFDLRLRSRMKSAREGGWRYNFLSLRPAPSLAWAAAVLLVVSASLYSLQERRNPGDAQQASYDNASTKKAPEVFGESGTAENNLATNDVKKDAVSSETIARIVRDDERRRVKPQRFLRAASPKLANVAAPSGGSSEFSLTSAKVLRLEIPLSASPESLRFVVTDERGNTRAVPVRGVSFGSQKLVEGDKARAQTITTGKGGVW